MEDRCVVCGSIIPEGRMVCPKCESDNRLKVGDTIKCKDTKDCIKAMQELIKNGIETDFLYEKNGEKGLWLEVIEVR